ncbi:MAG: hypothetical protein DRP01_08225, partial [Archaeoglobales archaeon]
MRIIPLTYWIEEEFDRIKKFIESAHPIFSRTISNEIEKIIRLYPEIYRETKEKLIEKSLKIAKETKDKINAMKDDLLNKIHIKKVQQSQNFMEKPVIGCDTSSNTLPIATVKMYAISGISVFVKEREV